MFIHTQTLPYTSLAHAYRGIINSMPEIRPEEKYLCTQLQEACHSHAHLIIMWPRGIVMLLCIRQSHKDRNCLGKRSKSQRGHVPRESDCKSEENVLARVVVGNWMQNVLFVM